MSSVRRTLASVPAHLTEPPAAESAADPPVQIADPLIDLTAERAFTGGLISFGPVAQKALATKLTTDSITEPGVWLLCRWIRQMHRDGLPVDMTTIPAFVEQNGLLEAGATRIALRTLIADLVCSSTIVPASADFLLHHLQQLAERRMIRAALRELLRVVENASTDDLLTIIREQIASITAAASRLEVEA